MKNLYICGTGFLGNEMMAKFQQDSTFSILKQFESLKRPQRLDYSIFTDLSSFLLQHGVSIFLNASGASDIQASFSTKFNSINEPATQVSKHLQLLDNTALPVTYVFFSSAAVYGNTGPTGASETDKVQPLSPYATGKFNAEERLMESLPNINPLISILILRIFSAYSNKLRSRLPHRIVTEANVGVPLTLSGTGNESRDFVHTDDIANAIKHILFKNQSRFQIVNVASGTGLNVRQVTELASLAHLEKFGNGLEFSFDHLTRTGDPASLVADISKLMSFGYTPNISPRDGLLDYFKENFTK